MDKMKYQQKLKQDGWTIFPSCLTPSLIESVHRELDAAYKTCRTIQVKNGIATGTDGTIHHLIGQGDSFLKVLEEIPIWDSVTAYFEEKNFILNSYGAVDNIPGNPSYVNKVHRDLRTFSGPSPMMLNMLIMLDRFTLENGATYLATCSHLKDERPLDEKFYASADRAVGEAGSVLLFNSNLFHAAGTNKTQDRRRALTLTYTPPYMKQQFDYPRILGYAYAEKLSERMKQLIGYNARVPATLDEWYQPPEKRMYRPGQG